MIARYQTKSMQELWSDARRYATWFAVELAYLKAYIEHQGLADDGLIARLDQAAASTDWADFALRVAHFEHETKHDVIAFLHAVEESMGGDARLIHAGLTSSDVVDTALALLLKSASVGISHKLSDVIALLWRLAQQYRHVPCLGRTHGQAAEPITFGVKLLSHVCEFARNHQRLLRAQEDIAVGQLSGAVGVYSHTHPLIEERALSSLGLRGETVSTQVVARDRHAGLFTTLAVLAGSVERLATEIRLLMHGEVGEVAEAFVAKQKGSSAMPHKQNPISSENLCGLMRMMRSYAVAALENQALWHERDISHSSVERIIAPDATSTMDFALTRLHALLEGLTVDAAAMKQNLADAGAVLCSQDLLLALVAKGTQRQKAYEMVQRAARGKGGSFRERVRTEGIDDIVGASACDDIISSEPALVHEDVLYQRVEKLLRDFGLLATSA